MADRFVSLFDPPLTLSLAIERVASALSAKSPTPRIDAEVLVRHVTGATRAELIAHPARPLSGDACRSLGVLTERRARGEPVAYLTGIREFWSLELRVTPDTLIPRPETELLVERALAHITTDTRMVADLGTGSGAIALALARERPRLRVIAIDRSEAALAVSRANAERLGVSNVEFRPGDWLRPLDGLALDLIVSNPPYLRENDRHLNEGDVRHEPRAALVAGPGGLEAIAHIIAAAPSYLVSGGWLLLEHGHDQGQEVRALLGNGFRDIRTYNDLARHERVSEGRRP